MNAISSNYKILFTIVIASFALFIVLVMAMFFTPSKTLSIPVYMILTLESELKETNGKEPQSWLSIISKDNNFKIVREDAVPIIKDIPDLLARLDSALKDGPMNEYLFKIEKPTSVNKKALRREIENNFHGIERQMALRSVIAVIELESPNPNDPYVREYLQFKDDLNYFQDNFGGVGLLVKNIEKRILENYGDIILEILMTTENQ